MQDEINLVWKYLLPAMQKDKLPANEELSASLSQRLSGLTIAPPAKGNESPLVSEISGKTYTMELNDKLIASISFHFMDNMCHLSLKKDTTVYQLAFGAGEWIRGETAKHGPNLASSEKVSFTSVSTFKVAGGFRWQDENTLELILRYIESPHTETLVCRFDKKKIEVEFQSSNNFGRNNPVLKGITKN